MADCLPSDEEGIMDTLTHSHSPTATGLNKTTSADPVDSTTKISTSSSFTDGDYVHQKHAQAQSVDLDARYSTSISSGPSAMLLPSAPSHDPAPSPTKLGKRKAEDVEDNLDPASTLHEVKEHSPTGPIAILPTPLPSKRLKLRPGSKDNLIPVERLPVYPLPSLPPITDDALRKQVFVHQSKYEKVKGKFQESASNPAGHYEKLEHVGDSILGMLVTTWLHETRPLLTCGTASKLKSHLVSNATLSHLSGLYGLPQRLDAEAWNQPVLRVQTDVRAALMESYIAGVYFSYPPNERFTKALPVLDGWLREMYDPLCDFFFSRMKLEHEQHSRAVGVNEEGEIILIEEQEKGRIDKASTGMLKLIKYYASNKGWTIGFDEIVYETSVGMLYEYRCKVDGKEVGRGTRAEKKLAKNVAALEAVKSLGVEDAPSA